MFSIRYLFIISFVLLFISSSTLALTQDTKNNPSQEARSNSSSAPTITAAFAADQVRFTALGEVEKLRLEVFSAASDLLFDSGFQPGSIRDWSFKDQHGQALAEGSYLCVVTVKDLSGKLRFKQGQILLQAGQASLQLADTSSPAAPDPDSGFATVADSSRQAVTVLAHDGKDGQVVSTSGALSFRLGNLFAGTDKEMMRLTPEGNFGIGFTHPQARLDVDGLIRSSQGILFPDGTMQFSAASKTLGTPSSRAGEKASGRQGLQPQAAGVGTQNFIAKWTDSAGTLGDSIMFESTGKIGVGTSSPSSVLDVAGAINTSTQYNISGQRVLSNAGVNNLFVGNYAGNVNTTGSLNTFVGFTAGYNNTTGSYNAFFGYNAGRSNTTGIQNAFFGNDAGNSNLTGFDNAFFGIQAGFSNTTGDRNSFFGAAAGRSNTTGSLNAFFGFNAGYSNTTGFTNAFFGTGAGFSNTTGSDNAFFGKDAGYSNTTGTNNSFFGKATGYNNTTGVQNAFFGTMAGIATTSGSSNSYFGESAGYFSTTGFNNSFFGNNAGYSNTTGANNSFFGREAGYSNTTGIQNTFIGISAGKLNTTGNFNAFFGRMAGNDNTTGSSNSFFGERADAASGNLQNATAIGANAQVSTSNSLVLGSINGINGASATINVGIGTTSPDDRLHVNGIIRVSSLGAAGSTQLCRNASNQISTCSSSLRYKSDLRPFAGGMSIINRLEPISFTWKEGGLRDVGFGAEAVEKIEPLFITYNADGQVEGMKYDRITVALVNALKEQQQQIAAQQMQIAELHSTKAENAKLKAQLADIVVRLEQVEKTRVVQK